MSSIFCFLFFSPIVLSASINVLPSLSYPCIRSTSSAISAVLSISVLKNGIFKFSPSNFISNLSSIFIISSLGMSVPNNLFTFSGSNFTVFTSCLFGYISTIVLLALPAPISSASSTALLIALIAFSGDNPFSYLPELSVLKPNFLAVSLTLPPLNTADSKTTVFVLSSISEFCPPITPATATGFSLSAITSIELSNFLSCSSNVVITSPSFALLTIMCFPDIEFISNACIGCPSSSIT